MGVTEQQLAALGDFESSEHFDRKHKLALRYAVAMTETPLHVSDELFSELKNTFDANQLVELTSCIAWENYRARFDHAFGVESMGFSENAYCPVPEGA